MDTDPAEPVRLATAAYTASLEKADKLLDELYAAISAASASGVRQNELVRITGYTRERIRQICDPHIPNRKARAVGR